LGTAATSFLQTQSLFYCSTNSFEAGAVANFDKFYSSMFTQYTVLKSPRYHQNL